MRQRRIKTSPTEGAAAYHCISRTVNGEWLFDDRAKEILRQQIWQVAEYCGVQIVTFAILSNHFHVLVDVPRREPVSDSELLRRYKILYPRPTQFQIARLAVVEAELAANGPEAVVWRRRQLALMGDVSQYMKLVKQRFTIWFNKSHRRFGTLWAERFKSVLLESRGRVCQTTAAYVDLNAVRAGLVTDPKDYRFCGYAMAVAGNAAAQEGIRSATEALNWAEAQADYRMVLFGTATGPRAGAATLTPAALLQVIEEGGRLPLATVLRCRIRFFTDGAVLGSRTFVETQLAKYCRETGRRKRFGPRPLPVCSDWDGWATLRSLRRGAFG